MNIISIFLPFFFSFFFIALTFSWTMQSLKPHLDDRKESIKFDHFLKLIFSSLSLSFLLFFPQSKQNIHWTY